ncbi:hypothetical protein [Shinella sp.]|uniref:hypothetical protein n=1 Tax=Shinella sp. TaxID=1870904 RepID=UPI00258D670A|nr:hypothetical protein [Shinella sp.]MCW5705673.1 hypothetical protein [Shinella sp.]
MNIIETPDMWGLCMRRRLRIPEIRQAAAELAPIIEGAVGDYGLTVAGPWIFTAHGLPKDGRTPFDWQICRPVEGPEGYGGTVELHRLEPTIVASRIHQGSLRTLDPVRTRPLNEKTRGASPGFSSVLWRRAAVSCSRSSSRRCRTSRRCRCAPW